MARIPAGFTIDQDGNLVPLRRRATTKRRFMARLSVEEVTALNAMRLDTSVPLPVRAALMTLAELRDMADEISFDDPDTRFGVQMSVELLASLPVGTPGRIPPENVSARVDAWLADYPQLGEPFP